MGKFTYSFLSLCKDLIRFLFSILHLLLTRILPLLALLLVSLLLHLFHFISTSLRPASTKSSLFRQRCGALQSRLRLQLGAGSSLGTAYSDALQEELQLDDDQLSPAYIADLHEEGYEDCVDEFIEEQRSLMSKDEEISSCQNGIRTAYNGELKDGMGDYVHKKSSRVAPDSLVPDLVKKGRKGGEGESLLEVGDSLQEVGDSLPVVGDSPAPQEAGDSLQKVGDFMGDSQLAATGDQIATLESEPSLFPSDLPPSLDLIVKAATANGSLTSTDQASSTKPTARALPPTLSSIEKTLQESSPSDVSNSEFEAAMPGRRPPAPLISTSSSSSGNFIAKFNQHFMVDGQTG